MTDATSPLASRENLLRRCAVIALVAAPWLSAYTAGPTPNVWPLLLSAVCALVLWLLRREIRVEDVAAGWVLAAAASALIGLLQYFGWAYLFTPWVSQTVAGDAFSNLRQRNQFATLTSIGLLALLALVPGRSPVPRRLPWWSVALGVLLALGNAASSSRTGLLQWVLIVLLMVCWTAPGRRRPLVVATGALGFYLLAVFTLPTVLRLVTGLESAGLFGRLTTSTGCSSRTVLWSNVLSLIAQKPWLGWGWGELDYAHFITLYPGPRFCEILDNAHNLPLHLAAELGIPAAVALCGAAAWVVWRARPWREQNPARQMAWGVLAVIGLHSLLEYPLWYGPFQMAAGLSVLLLWTTRTRKLPSARELEDVSAPSGLRLLHALVLALLTACLLATAFSYYRVSQLYLSPTQRNPAYRDDTLAKVRDTWLFRDQARFAELSMTALDRDNAATVHDMALDLLHFSPEARVVEKLIESAVLLGRDDEALFYLERFRAAYPAEHARWADAHATTAVRLDGER